MSRVRAPQGGEWAGRPVQPTGHAFLQRHLQEGDPIRRDEGRRVIVMKIGSSLLDSRHGLECVARAVAAQHGRPVLVVAPVLPDLRELLEGAAWAACYGRDARAAHWAVASYAFRLLDRFDLASDFVDDLLDSSLSVLHALHLMGEWTLRAMERVLSVGPSTTARITAEVLRRAGLPACVRSPCEFGLFTDADYGRATILPEATSGMREAWERFRHDIPVIAGGMGTTAQGWPTTLGIGGDDLMAAHLAHALEAEELQLLTDTPGLPTCDSTVVKGACTIPRLSFQEAAELAYVGARIVHPRCIEPAARAGIPVRIRSALDPEGTSTVIAEGVAERGGHPAGIAFRRRVSLVNVFSTEMLAAGGFLGRLFGVFARHAISVDVVSTSEVNVSFTVDRSRDEIQGALDEVAQFARVTVTEGRCIVCVVGGGLDATKGLAGRMLGALDREGVSVEMISGVSQVGITLVVRDVDHMKAVRALHEELLPPNRNKPATTRD